MKRILFLLILLAPSVRAQTITLGPVSKSLLCVGDSVIVPYQATGTFAADNKFFVQLSDANGSFTSFKSIGNNTSTNGSFSILLGAIGSHFRVKVASTDPYIVSDSNASDIQSIALPRPQPISNPTWQFVGDPIQILDNEPAGSQFSWSFNDSDASIKTSQDPFPTLTYVHEGQKTGGVSVTNRSGCTQTESFSFNILSCHPTIPSNVHIVTGSESDSGFSFVLVKPGGSYRPTYTHEFQEVIFVEAGATVFIEGSGDYVNIYYIRPGASIISYANEYNSTVVQDSGSSKLPVPNNFYCPDLTFDYSQIPLASVTENPVPTFSLIQSGDHLFANSEETPYEIRIMNILGAEVLSQHGTGALDVDLAPLPAGVYFAVVQSGDAREVRKIAVVH